MSGDRYLTALNEVGDITLKIFDVIKHRFKQEGLPPYLQYNYVDTLSKLADTLSKVYMANKTNEAKSNR